MKLLNSLFLFIAISSFISAQSKDLALDYERATKLTNANEALEIYQEIINSNEDSDYVWLSKLKKAEMFYAKGSYITSSNILKEYNLNAPTHLQSQSSKDLLYKSLDAAGESDSLKVYQKLLSTNKIKKNTSKKSTNRVWFIQFGAFSSIENATILKDSLTEEKINNIRIDQVFKNGKMIYYVRSNHYNSYDKALNQSKKLKNKTKFTISGF
jgi:cell division septation protein DedD|tara:strand:+ start:803 stop:1438 length:636 start_codon:yes stop_codon:yes gene_type:complete